MMQRLNGTTKGANGNGENGNHNHLTRRTIRRSEVWGKNGISQPHPIGHRELIEPLMHHNHRNRNHRPNGMIELGGENFAVIQETRRGVKVVEEVLGRVVRGGQSFNMTPKAELADPAKNEGEYFDHSTGKTKEHQICWVYVKIDDAGEAGRVRTEYNAKLPARKDPVVGSEAF